MSFDNVAFTKHALERIELRRVTKEMVIQTIYHPNRQFTEANGNIKFICKVHGCKIHAICKPLPEENKWLVISVWVRGEDDHGNRTVYKGYKGYKGNRNRKQDTESLFNLLIVFAIIMGIILFIIWNVM